MADYGSPLGTVAVVPGVGCRCWCQRWAGAEDYGCSYHVTAEHFRANTRGLKSAPCQSATAAFNRAARAACKLQPPHKLCIAAARAGRAGSRVGCTF